MPLSHRKPYANNDEALLREQIKILYQGTPLSLVGTLLIALLLSSSSAIAVPDLTMNSILWFAFIIFISGMRLRLWWQWQKNKALSDQKLPLFLNLFRVGTWCAGAAWGSASFLMYIPGSVAQGALLSFALAGVASGALTALAVDRTSAVGFVLLAILPLTFQTFFMAGSAAVAMSIMLVLFILFVGASSFRAQKNLQEQVQQRQKMAMWHAELEDQQALGKIITKAQSAFILKQEQREELRLAFDQILVDIVTLTKSDKGLIGEISYRQTHPQVSHYTFYKADQSSATTQAAHDGNEESNPQKSLKPLIGRLLLEQKPIIHAAADTDPSNEEPLITSAAMLGIPIFSQQKMVAVLLLSNARKNYEATILHFLQPLLSTIAQLIEAVHHARQHRADQNALQESVQHTQAIMDEVIDGILTIDQYGMILSFNRAAESIFGYTERQIIGTNIDRLISTEHRNDYYHFFSEHQINTQESLRDKVKELVGMRRDRREFAMEIAISDIFRNGKLIYVGVVRDISERKRIERMKNEFISTVSHELRTPLTSITGSLGLLVNGSLGNFSNTVGNMLNIAHKNSLRLHHLINDLLDMDKLLEGKMNFNLQSYPLMEIVEQSVESTLGYAKTYNVNLHISERLDDVKVKVDSHRLQQVLANLISNAIKFSPAQASVNIRVHWQYQKVRVSVIDQGEGINEEFKPKIFQKFSQADSSSTRQKEGTGLGLAISKELIENMNGTIGFQSQEGKGSCFYFDLPIVRA